MSDPLYRKELLRLAADAHGAGRLAAPDATGVAFNPACGDRVTADIAVREGCVWDVALETKACVLAQASASILGRTLASARRADIERLHQSVTAMLEIGSDSPAPPFADYGEFRGAVEYANRHRCVLLPIEAILAAFDKLE